MMNKKQTLKRVKKITYNNDLDIYFNTDVKNIILDYIPNNYYSIVRFYYNQSIRGLGKENAIIKLRQRINMIKKVVRDGNKILKSVIPIYSYKYVGISNTFGYDFKSFATARCKNIDDVFNHIGFTRVNYAGHTIELFFIRCLNEYHPLNVGKTQTINLVLI